MEKVRPWCCQPSDRGRLKNRTEQLGRHLVAIIYMMHATGAVVVHPETTVVEIWKLSFHAKYHVRSDIQLRKLVKIVDFAVVITANSVCRRM